MRIISQDGNVDLPYEKFVFGITKDNKIACCRECVAPPYEIYNGIIAEYSSKEKALKAMEMLREAWINGTVEFEDGIYHRNIIFQFPQDDEIEV